MDEGLAATARYWCQTCSRVIVPVMELEIKCPFCGDGFVEEMDSTGNDQGAGEEFEADRDRALSLWASVLPGMISNHRRRRRMIRRFGFDDEEEENYYEHLESRRAGELELDPEIESIIRRRRSSARILQLLQSIRDRTAIYLEFENTDPDRDGDQERERAILINPFGQTIVVQGSSNQSFQTSNLIGSFGDFIDPGLDLLLQHLSENNPNRNGTPPAQKEAIEAMSTVKIDENVQCSVCLDDLEVGSEAREMPCKHKFHEACILPWLELHNSCPVCRFQLPAEEVKNNSERSRDGNDSGEQERGGVNRGNVSASEEPDENPRNGRMRRFQFPWPFNSLFSSSSGSQANTTGNSMTSSSSSPSSSNAHEGVSHGNDDD